MLRELRTGDRRRWRAMGILLAAVLSIVPLHPLPVAAQTQVPAQAVTNHSSEVDDDDDTPGVPAMQARPTTPDTVADADDEQPANQPLAPLPGFRPVVTPAAGAGTFSFAAVADPGLSMFIWGQEATTKRDLQLATSAGFGWQKTLFQWRLIEGHCKRCWNWIEADRVVRASNAAGVRIIARLDLPPAWARIDGATNGPPDNFQDYTDFVSEFAERYNAESPIGHVEAVEIWNEVNIDREWGNQPIGREQAAEYVRLLTGAYKAVKASDRLMVVVTAGLAPTGVTDGHSADDVEYLQWLFDAGLEGGVNYDVLGAHGNTQAPCVECELNSLPDFAHPSFYFRRVEQLHDVLVRNGDANRQIWLLEFGWTADKVHPAYSWFAVSEDQKAKNIVRAFEYARENWGPWIGVMTLWTLPDPSWTADRQEYWWAITNPDGSPRPAYEAVANAHHHHHHRG